MCYILKFKLFLFFCVCDREACVSRRESGQDGALPLLHESAAELRVPRGGQSARPHGRTGHHHYATALYGGGAQCVMKS